MNQFSCAAEIGGRTLKLESGKFALQANASVMVTYGETVVLATLVKAEKPRAGIEYFPLMVEYEPKLYAAGKIKGSRFIKREGRPSDEAIINARMIDRTLRPLFNQNIREDLQVVIEVLCYDGVNEADVLGIIGGIAVAALSEVPFKPILGACCVGLVDGELVLNPSAEAKEKGELDLVVSSSLEKVVMLEGEAKEIGEEKFLEAVEFGKKHNLKVIELLEKMVKAIGRPKLEIKTEVLEKALQEEARRELTPKLEEILYLPQKQDRKKALKKLIEDQAVILAEKHAASDEKKNERLVELFESSIAKLAEEIIQRNILQSEKRIDGRKITEVRPLDIEVGILPRTHGTGYFKRGETQVLTVATLGAPSAEQIVDDMEEEYKKRYMHHYNFPPFSVGEVKPLRGPSRRDVGHGMLAEKALEKLLPPKEEFPYTIRLVSEVFGSNGSSSMAATCGSSLALMDAGVPLPCHVAGIAMGLVQDKNGTFKVLTDLQDLEDSEGGMDFKIAGSEKGITAVQLDVKGDGLTDMIVKQTVEQNREARHQVLKQMNEVIPQFRPELSPYAPRIITFKINPEKIREVIGPGGKVINGIIAETGVEIDLEDDGTVMITSVDPKASEKAVAIIEDITREAKVGEEYVGKVNRIEKFGAFVEIFPKCDGLIHISKLAPRRVNRVEDVVKMGEKIKVKVIEIDSMGRVNLVLIQKM